jgi:hypothetical protein
MDLYMELRKGTGYHPEEGRNVVSSHLDHGQSVAVHHPDPELKETSPHPEGVHEDAGQHPSHPGRPAFNSTYDPDQAAPFPGLYRCVGCGEVIALARGRNLPPQNHHRHSSIQGTIRWQLVSSHPREVA